jgi:hypothetical protein
VKDREDLGGRVHRRRVGPRVAVDCRALPHGRVAGTKNVRGGALSGDPGGK